MMHNHKTYALYTYRPYQVIVILISKIKNTKLKLMSNCYIQVYLTEENTDPLNSTWEYYED